jgi:predicted amidohydrolase YtcJ
MPTGTAAAQDAPMKHASIGWLLTAALPLAARAAEPVTPPADLILSKGEIRTPAGWAQSMAVSKGVIVAVGDDQAITAYRGAGTRVIDLAGATVVPGFHDMHIHPTGAGLWQRRCMFPQGSTAQVVVETVRGCAAQRGKGAWITGGSWDTASFGKSPPHRRLLDAVTPDNPVVLNDISGHSTLANSRALQLAGITRATPDPQGGIIERDTSGEPTGVLRENASFMVSRLVPPSTQEETVEALHWALDQMLALGVTSFTDAGTDRAINPAYATLADRGVLKQRVRGCYMWSPVRQGPDGRPESDPTSWVAQFARERFRPDCIKLVLDGVPTTAHTGAMVEPYEETLHDHGTGREKGLLMIPADLLNRTVTDLDRRGWTVKFHAAGDGAVHAGIDAIAAARKANGFSGLHHNVGHCSFVQQSDFDRAAALGVTFEMSPYIWYPNPIIPDIEKAVGAKRMQHWTPVKGAINSGALVVAGSDWPVVPSLNPWVALETLVTRKAPGGAGPELGGAEKITLDQAFDLFTVNAAQQMGQRHLVGSIEAGKLADVLILDRNIFRIPVTQIHQTQVRTTLINGEVVYQAGSGPVRQPPPPAPAP